MSHATPDNPLLDTRGLPRFAEIRPEHVTPAIDTLLADADAALQAAVGDGVPADYDALSAVLDVAVERLRRGWGAVGHLQSVVDTPALRAAYTENLPRVTEFMTRLGADERLYAKYKAVAASPAAARLSPAKRKALADALRDFVLGGAELQGAARVRFAQLQDRMAALSQQFGEHVLDATDGFALFVDTEALDGVPADVLAATRAAAEAEGQPGHKLTLHAPVYLPVLQYATNRALREQLFRAHVTRASEFGPPELDNSALMRELVELRQEEAALLGHANYAQVSLVAKMAESPEQVLAFVRDLAQRARPHAERDLAELEAFAARELGMLDLQAWDRPFASERLKQARFAFSSDEVKQYFTEPRALQGLFRLVETLFDVSIRPGEASVWHDSVRYFHVERGGEPLAGFFVDLYARNGKSGGAWMDEVRARWVRPDGTGLQLPVAHLVCNFAPPVGDQPALLTHDDLITLFHEFGHGLHHMLTRVDEAAVAGISGVEWDAAELPSQFLENFCWEWEVLSTLSAHVQTGAPLPRALFDKMVAARNFQSGLQMLRHCEYALFDMRLHAEPGTASRVQAIADEVHAEIAVAAKPPFQRFAHSFGHIFDGGYAAGYYGYAWAEVLSADAFSAFEEAGLFDAATGRRYMESILEVGGSRPALESFIAFRGRAPRIDALLRHQGMA
ncbi:M3 family metallopeptidase [Rubrivivax sp. RP6-9]|uniref:M3 family metallopeptidase n=1 Tax=Rubrivivax sp. RP6-9 TaxID=3415750 RepID=UPI003CC6818C